MKTRMKLWTLAATGLLALTACSDEHEANEVASLQVEFKMYVDIMTRAYTPESGFATSFADNDEVGIFACDETDGAVYTNVRYTQVGVNQWSGEPIMASNNTAYSYYAYHPYDEAVNDPTNVPVSVDADQTQGYDSSDVLYASATVTPTAETATVDLKYNHAFSLVQVELSGDKVTGDAVVTLKNVKTTGTLDLTAATPTTTLTGDASEVKMRKCGNASKYRAVVPAQTITAGSSILTVVMNGVEYDYKYSVDVPYNVGKCRQYNVTIGETPKECTISVVDSDITAWGEDKGLEGNGTVTENAPGLFTFGGKDALSAGKANNGTLVWDETTSTLKATFAADNNNVNITFSNFNQTISADHNPIIAVLVDYEDGTSGMKLPKLELTVDGTFFVYENLTMKDYRTGKYVAYQSLLANPNKPVEGTENRDLLKTGTHNVTTLQFKSDRKDLTNAADFYIRAIKSYASEAAMKAELGIQ